MPINVGVEALAKPVGIEWADFDNPLILYFHIGIDNVEEKSYV
jgi:hypothetical protein